MKEVDAKRVAGPFNDIPFNNFIQSLVGLVPKAGNKTRMIFHLSYDFGELEPSMNTATPKNLCLVKYNDLDCAVQQWLQLEKEWEEMSLEEDDSKLTVFMGKTDLSAAFRILPLKICCICWLVFKARDPADGKFKYFVEKCLPFGASISCSHYQRFSNALKHILQYRVGTRARSLTNYLDDFLFLALVKAMCNQMIHAFLLLCQELNVPVAVEKTEWADSVMVFLGILLDGRHLTLLIPLDKQAQALKLLNDLSHKRRITVKQMQTLTGYLNFLTKAIFAGMTFTHRMYSKYANIKAARASNKLKPHYHISMDYEFRFDCEIWRTFLSNYRSLAVCRPMVDLGITLQANHLNFYSDTSANELLGFGAIFDRRWLFAQWESGYIKRYNPSIEYLKLVGLTVALMTWGHLIQDQRIVIFCDNQAVVAMINNMVSKCQHCMKLIRLIILDNLIHNRRVYAKYISLSDNFLSDALSRLQFDHFWRLAPANMDLSPCEISPLVWPASKIWE